MEADLGWVKGARSVPLPWGCWLPGDTVTSQPTSHCTQFTLTSGVSITPTHGYFKHEGEGACAVSAVVIYEPICPKSHRNRSSIPQTHAISQSPST